MKSVEDADQIPSVAKSYANYDEFLKNKLFVMTLRGATLSPFETPRATPLGILTSSYECYITLESQTSNKTPISPIITCVKCTCILFFFLFIFFFFLLFSL